MKTRRAASSMKDVTCGSGAEEKDIIWPPWKMLPSPLYSCVSWQVLEQIASKRFALIALYACEMWTVRERFPLKLCGGWKYHNRITFYGNASTLKCAFVDPLSVTFDLWSPPFLNPHFGLCAMKNQSSTLNIPACLLLTYCDLEKRVTGLFPGCNCSYKFIVTIRSCCPFPNML